MKTRIGELITGIRKGRKVEGASSSFKPGLVRYIQIEDLHGGGNSKYVVADGHQVSKSDELVAWDGANAGTVGFNFVGVIGSTLASIRFQPEIHPPYAARFLQSKFSYLRLHATGATIPHVNGDVLRSLEIPLRSIAEQRQIAGMIETADRLRRLRRTACEVSDNIIPSLFLEIFGDPRINSKHFPMVSLSEVYSKGRPGTKCGPFGSALKRSEFTERGVPVWTMENIRPNRFVEANCLFVSEQKFIDLAAYEVRDGDILISRAGTVGRMCVAHPQSERSLISTNLIRLSLNNEQCLPVYFTTLMTHFADRVGKIKAGQEDAYTFMNTGVLESLQIPLPPFPLQQEFKRLFDQVDRTFQQQIEAERQAEHLFQTLLHRSFN